MEKRQHTFLRDGRQALEGKLNLSKDAVGALRDSRFVSKYMYADPAWFFRFLCVFLYGQFIYYSFFFSFCELYCIETAKE